MREGIMKQADLVTKAQFYLETLCSVKPNRRTGSSGNREATDFFENTIRPFGYELDATPFACLDYVSGGAVLKNVEESFEVHPSPYSLGCDVFAELFVVTTVEELESANCQGKILLMMGKICSEQLMPKNFVFYNPEHHQKIIALLESHRPAGIVTATEKKPEQVGALYPFPLMVDGDFDIPNVYCKDTVGEALAARQGEPFHLRIDGRRIPSSGTNVIARLHPGAPRKIILTAHIDAYEDAPGAADNASGTVVLLLLAEMLSDDRGDHCVEIAVFNGEDHYSAAGQMDYLKRYGEQLPKVMLAINVDGVGYKRGRSAYSFYGCPPQIEGKSEEVFQRFPGLVRGEPWFAGDHMIFVQNHAPSIAFTSECAPELMKTVIHTAADTPDIIDYDKLAEVANSIQALVRSL
jgi:aminopeptidase YwaD